MAVNQDHLVVVLGYLQLALDIAPLIANIALHSLGARIQRQVEVRVHHNDLQPSHLRDVVAALLESGQLLLVQNPLLFQKVPDLCQPGAARCHTVRGKAVVVAQSIDQGSGGEIAPYSFNADAYLLQDRLSRAFVVGEGIPSVEDKLRARVDRLHLLDD